MATKTEKIKAPDLGKSLRQLEKHFGQVEPHVRAFLEERNRWRRLQDEARALQRRYRKPEGRPPLFGMTVGVKDIFRVDGFETRAGSQLPASGFRGPESKAVSQLRAAGALIVGKTVTTEFAYFAPGATRNPHNLEHTPGGSSSGSAAAVAAGLATLGIGSQTIGSTIRPASFCGVVGFKPTYGRISTEGVIPLSKSLDHVGLFAPDVETAEMAAAVLCENWRDTPALSEKPVLAVPVGAYLERAEEENLAIFQRLVEKLGKAGYWVKELNPMPDFEEVVARHQVIVAAEAAEAHAQWYGPYSERYHARTAELIEEGRRIKAQDLEAARKDARAFRARISTLMELHGIDLWICPSAPGPAPRGLEKTGDPIMNLPWTQAGLPALGLPTGRAANGLPLGTQFVADQRQDEDLFGWVKAIQDLLRGGN